MADPMSDLGCRVLDKDGEQWATLDFREEGYTEAQALERAEYMATNHPKWGPYTVVRVTTETLHTIHALEGK